MNYNRTALARSNEPDKASRAVAILEEMKTMPGAQPNAYTYNAVLSAAAFTKGTVANRNEALRVAVTIFEQALRFMGGKHDRQNVTYGLFFTACGNLAFDRLERVEMLVDESFDRCCREGQVDDKVLRQVWRASTPALRNRLLAQVGVVADQPAPKQRRQRRTMTLRASDCPPEWSRNCVYRPHRRRVYSSSSSADNKKTKTTKKKKQENVS